ncbi:MAG: response regulator transcription factor [Gemmatimonadetes bacterium]|nr:response regulator transcription factor [Gemmatimonadota bacterium]
MEAARSGDPGLLLVEDDAELASILAQVLQVTRRKIVHARTLDFARRQLGSRRWGLVVLDAGLPDGDGFDLCREIRRSDADTPVLILTARCGELDRVCGLEIGADDYLGKPFNRRELLLRVHNLLHRCPAASGSAGRHAMVRCGDVAIDTLARRAFCRDAQLTLTPREFDLLAFLACHTDRVFSRAQLLDAVWGAGFEGYEHTVNSHIHRLRCKIEINADQPQRLVTVWGRGYRLTRAPTFA